MTKEDIIKAIEQIEEEARYYKQMVRRAEAAYEVYQEADEHRNNHEIKLSGLKRSLWKQIDRIGQPEDPA